VNHVCKQPFEFEITYVGMHVPLIVNVDRKSKYQHRRIANTIMRFA